MKNDKVGSFAWFTKMNEANDEQKDEKFFNSKDRYKHVQDRTIRKRI